MSTKISQDFERLSAYIDNQLSPAEKADLEARLAKEADLQATLTELRRTVRALRSLPAVKPPRSFTLTPEQVPQRARRGPLFPVFRLAAALCTLLLVLTVARDYATSSLGAAAVANVTTQGGGASTVVAPNVAPLLTPSPEGSLEAYSASGPAPTGNPSQDTAVTPLAHLAPMAEPTATPSATDRQGLAPATPDATNKSAAPTETQEDMTASVAAAPSASETASPNAPLPTAAAPAPSPVWRVVEIVLAALALVLAGAAWLTRRA